MILKIVQGLHNLETYEAAKRWISQSIAEIVNVVNGNLTFGENLRSSLVEVQMNAANVTQAVSHGLGLVPTGYLVVGRSANLTVYDGDQENTSDIIYIRATAVGTIRLLVF